MKIKEKKEKSKFKTNFKFVLSNKTLHILRKDLLLFMNELLILYNQKKKKRKKKLQWTIVQRRCKCK
mgnify:CR=1 FL=1